jgi:PEGA domain.
MRLTATIVCTLFLALTALAAEQPGTGDLHVLAPLGTRVFVDGHLAGISLGAKAGLTVQNVAAGPHVVRVTRGNYNPRIMTVTVHRAHWSK